jgi:hypothetical protein
MQQARKHFKIHKIIPDEVVRTSETSINFYKITRHNIPEGRRHTGINGGVDWTKLAQNRVQYRNLVNRVLSKQVMS